MGEMRNMYNILIGKPEGKRPLGRPSCERIILDWFLRREWENVDWMNLAKDRNQ
jgi:hypothetical protein